MIARRAVVIALITLVWTHRSPAPIVEEEKPTPAPSAAQPEAPKRKRHSTKSASTEPTASPTETRTKASSSTSQGPARFAGTWSGKINQGLLGHVPSSVTVNGNATSVELSHNLGGNTRPATINGNSLSWKSGLAGEITWTLTPSGDGQTAQLTMKGMLLNDTTTFRRGK